jgi:nucleotide-binding universal stress UspA family protein
MSPSGSERAQAKEDFVDARNAADRRRFLSRLLGRDEALVPFSEVEKTLGALNRTYRGVQAVPLDKIIGSLERSDDFDRKFLPTQGHSISKWLSVDQAYLEGKTLPPITLYKVGDAYFVVDGHHRISAGRTQGLTFIDAEVTEVKSRVPVTADLKLQDLDLLGAYQGFLEQTRLDALRPDQNVRLTMPGDYARLLEHIRVHRYLVQVNESRQMSDDEAVTHWYDTVYWPVVQVIREHTLLKDFPGRTEADLYLWIVDHAYYVSKRIGWSVSFAEVALDFARRYSRRPAYTWQRLRRRVLETLVPEPLEPGARPGIWRQERVQGNQDARLFRDILVTLTGAETGWHALAQAAEFARREGGALHGLHVARNQEAESTAYGKGVLAEFERRCQQWGVAATSSLATGDVADTIIGYAQWADLVVINQRVVQGVWAERPLGTIFQMVAARSARPLLVVPGAEVRPIRRVLLAYDDSPKAREALFVFRRLLGHWEVDGTLLTVESAGAQRAAHEQACSYLRESACPPFATRYEQGEFVETLLRVLREEQADLVVMGSYGVGAPLVKAVTGSTVNQVLRQAWLPVLVCQ